MNLSHAKLIDGLMDEIFAVIHKYDETMYVTSVIGALELVKQQLILDHIEVMEDDDE